MNEMTENSRKPLRRGYTTGSCAAAAAKAAAYMLLTGRRKETVGLTTPNGTALTLPVSEIEIAPGRVRCAVRKDAGDDPDVTNGARIVAEVSFSEAPGIAVDGGAGVGRVTKPGLDQPMGAAAINSVPRRMIAEGVGEVLCAAGYDGGISVIISVPEGQSLALKTFNPRLGIEGGISIIGTTGVVEPMSEQALVDTIGVELRQRRALGADYALFTPGNYGADFLKGTLNVAPEVPVLVSNFIGDALDLCKELGFRGALLVGHIGKLVKLAGGMFNTHSKYGDCRMELIAAHAAACGLDAAAAGAVLNAVSCVEALRVLDGAGLREQTLARLTERVAANLERRAGDGFEIGAILYSNVYGLLSETAGARDLLRKLTEG